LVIVALSDAEVMKTASQAGRPFPPHGFNTETVFPVLASFFADEAVESFTS